MANIVFFIVLIGVLAGLAVHGWRRARRPAARLRRSFKRLRANVLVAVPRASREEASRLLRGAERYLDGLVRTREQQALLGELRAASTELLGGRAPHEPSATEDRLGRTLQAHVEQFFGQLSRIAAATSLQDDTTLHALRSFAEDMELQRSVLLELTRELQAPPPPLPEPKTSAALDEETATSSRRS